LTLVTLAAMPLGTPASAQGLFNSWFGNQRPDDRYPRQDWFGQQRREYTPQANAYSDPNAPGQTGYSPYGGQPQASSGGGRGVAYCVRLCDGRYFPIQRHANATAVQLCSAFCPAAKTQVFNGSQIDHAYASNGQRYADLDNAFAYRQKIVPGCTCNGKDAFGLARIDVAADPTLRPGDIVASGDNVKAALIAMQAAKERQPKPEPVNAKTAKRELPAGVKVVTPDAAPADDDAERPED
jgi:hypothetical protein